MKTYDQDEYITLDQEVLKTSSEDEDRKRLQDVFIKTNDCWLKAICLAPYFIKLIPDTSQHCLSRSGGTISIYQWRTEIHPSSQRPLLNGKS